MADVVSDKELDRVISSIDKATEALAHMITKNGETTQTLIERVAKLEVQVSEAGKDIKQLDDTIRGNGRAGLATRMDLVEQGVEGVRGKLKGQAASRAEMTKSKMALIGVLISGSLSGLALVAKALIEHM